MWKEIHSCSLIHSGWRLTTGNCRPQTYPEDLGRRLALGKHPVHFLDLRIPMVVHAVCADLCRIVQMAVRAGQKTLTGRRKTQVKKDGVALIQQEGQSLSSRRIRATEVKEAAGAVVVVVVDATHLTETECCTSNASEIFLT